MKVKNDKYKIYKILSTTRFLKVTIVNDLCKMVPVFSSRHDFVPIRDEISHECMRRIHTRFYRRWNGTTRNPCSFCWTFTFFWSYQRMTFPNAFQRKLVHLIAVDGIKSHRQRRQRCQFRTPIWAVVGWAGKRMGTAENHFFVYSFSYNPELNQLTRAHLEAYPLCRPPYYIVKLGCVLSASGTLRGSL